MSISKIAQDFSEKDWYHEEIDIPESVILHNDEMLNKLCNK